MNNKQQTAVEWFWNQLPEILPFTVDTETAVKLQEAYQQTKEMFEQQIIEAYQKGVIDEYGDSLDFSNCSDAENYIKETYGGNK